MQKYKIFALTLVHFPKKTYLRAAMSLGRLGLHCSFHICPPLLSYRTFRACGEIGRRARLRIWWFMPCRFESYQAHHNPPPTASQKPSGIFYAHTSLPPSNKWQPSTPPSWGRWRGLSRGRWRGLFLCSYHTKNTIRASADSLIVSADAIRKPADTIRIFSALQNLLIFSEKKTSNS